MNLKTETKTALIDLELISYSHAAKAESTGTGLQSLVEMVEFTIQSVVSACRAQKHYLDGTTSVRCCIQTTKQGDVRSHLSTFH